MVKGFLASSCQDPERPTQCLSSYFLDPSPEAPAAQTQSPSMPNPLHEKQSWDLAEKC